MMQEEDKMSLSSHTNPKGEVNFHQMNSYHGMDLKVDMQFNDNWRQAITKQAKYISKD